MISRPKLDLIMLIGVSCGCSNSYFGRRTREPIYFQHDDGGKALKP